MTERPSVARLAEQLARARGGALDALLAEWSDDDRSGVRAACEAARSARDRRRKESSRIAAMYKVERTLRAEGLRVVAGVDEVGRGALAGPLTVAAVVLPASPRIPGLDDSKRLTPARREELAEAVREVAEGIGIAHVSPDEIDTLGITAALRRAIDLAVAGLPCAPDHVVLDGLRIGSNPHETAIVKADGKVAAVAAASIVAKVTRDALMREVAAEHPEYGFEVNKGYGTSEHLAAITRFGPSPIHRRSFSWGAITEPLF